MSGKGSLQRPRLVSRDKFEDNWDRIFNKREKALDELTAESQKMGMYDDVEDVDMKDSRDRYPLG